MASPRPTSRSPAALHRLGELHPRRGRRCRADRGPRRRGARHHRCRPATYANLPTGASCILTEVGSDPQSQSTTISPAGPYVIGDDDLTDPIEVTVTNEFTDGGLVILKDLRGAGAERVGAGPVPLLGAVHPGRRHDVQQRRRRGGASGNGEVDPLRGAHADPIGSECVVTETDRAGADETPAPLTVTVVEDDATDNVVVAAFVNEYSAGTVELTKTVDGDAAAQHARDRFTVLVTCQLEVDGEPSPATLYSEETTVRAGQTVPLRDADGDAVMLPLGTHCFAEEIRRRRRRRGQRQLRLLRQRGHRHRGIPLGPPDLRRPRGGQHLRRRACHLRRRGSRSAGCRPSPAPESAHSGRLLAGLLRHLGRRPAARPGPDLAGAGPVEDRSTPAASAAPAPAPAR